MARVRSWEIRDAKDAPVPHQHRDGFKGWAEGEPYGEQLFQQLLSIERKRSWRSGRSFLLMLVDLDGRPGMRARIDPAVAAALFSGLRSGLRGADFVGWYQEGHMVGAVLTSSCHAPGTDVSRLVAQRVRGALCARLSPEVIRGLRMRVHDEPRMQEDRIERPPTAGIGTR